MKKLRPKRVNVLNVWEDEVKLELWEKQRQKEVSRAFESLERATADLAAGKIDVLVTAPISKEAMGKSGFKFPGHTEYLADMAGQDEALMLMVSPNITCWFGDLTYSNKEVCATVTVDKV